MRARLAPLGAALLLACGGGEGGTHDAAVEAGPATDGGCVGACAATPCGQGPAALALGVGRPFVANPEGRFEVGVGLQGGFHVDVSLRVSGTIDPDHTDIELTLWRGPWRVAEHVTEDWLLHIIESGPHCEYLSARMVLLDEQGGLLSRERVPGLTEGELELRGAFRSAIGGATARWPLSLQLPADW